MTEPARESGPRRVVVAIDASDASGAVLEDAAMMAVQLKAELVGLLIEDAELLSAADLPVTRLVPAQARREAQVDAAAMRRAYRVWSDGARRRVAATAERWRLSWSCQSTSGRGADQLLALLSADDMLAVSVPAVALGRDDQSAYQSFRHAACSVLVVQRCGTRSKPVAVVFNGRESTLAAGLDLAGRYRSPLLVLAVGATPDETAALAEQAGAWLQSRRQRAQVIALSDPTEDDLAGLLGRQGPGTLVYARSSPFAQQLDRALERQPCSLLVLC